MSKINILHVTLALDIGGVEILLLELLKKINRVKYNFSVCVLQQNGQLISEFEEIGIPVYCLPKNEGIDFSLPFRLKKLIKNKGIKIVHTHNSTPWLYVGVAKLIANDVKLVHTKHSNHNIKQWKLIKVESLVSRITDFIIADAKDVYDFMVKKQGIKEDIIKLVYNGIDVLKFSDKGKAEKGNEIKRIGIIGRLVPVKDHRMLIDAFRIVLNKMKNIELMIVGDGPLRGELIEYCDKKEIKEYVKFLGARRDIPELMKQFDLFVLCSLDEGMSITLLEAMASGLPVIATNVGGNSEVVVDNETGFLIPLGEPEQMANKIISLLSNTEMAKRMGENGKQRVMDFFSIQVMVEEYEKIYASFAG